MSSGPSRIVFNNLERLLSNDFNRQQAFLAAAAQQAWRARYGTPFVNSRLYPGLQSAADTVAAPSFGEVYSGLMVRPDADPTAGQFLSVDAGLAMIVDPTGGGDFRLGDSAYLLCDDPGLQAPGVLAFTPNNVASTVRWDIVECQPVDTVLEQSSRDTYNPATGLFTPGIVDKVRAIRLTYRIRQGTPGGGFSGGAAGWLPLAVIAVYNGFSTDFSKCDFWDVRPLVDERVAIQQSVDVNATSLCTEAHAQYASGTNQLCGYAEAEFAGYRAGGALRTSTTVSTPLTNFGSSNEITGGDADAVVKNTANQGPIVLPGVETSLYVGAFFPKPSPGQPFIPRWVRYSQAADEVQGRRVPRGPRGFILYTTEDPETGGIWDEFPIAGPSNMQLGVNLVGVRLLALGMTSTGTVYGGTLAGRRWQHNALFRDDVFSVPYKVTAIGVTATQATFAISDGPNYPVGARSLCLSMQIDPGEDLTPRAVRVYAKGTVSGNIYGSVNTYWVPGNADTVMWIPTFELLMPPSFRGSYPAYQLESISIVLDVVNFSGLINAHLMIHGWEL